MVGPCMHMLHSIMSMPIMLTVQKQKGSPLIMFATVRHPRSSSDLMFK